MNASVTLDLLLSNSSGTTLYFDGRNCPKDLIKEVILRGFQVSDVIDSFSVGNGFSNGYGNKEGIVGGFGDGESNGYGEGGGSNYNFPFIRMGGEGKIPCSCNVPLFRIRNQEVDGNSLRNVYPLL